MYKMRFRMYMMLSLCIQLGFEPVTFNFQRCKELTLNARVHLASIT